MKKKLVNQLIDAKWKCYYKNEKFCILSKYSKDSHGKWYRRDLKEVFKTPFVGIWYVICGLGLIILTIPYLISTLWGFIPQILFLED